MARGWASDVIHSVAARLWPFKSSGSRKRMRTSEVEDGVATAPKRQSVTAGSLGSPSRSAVLDEDSPPVPSTSPQFDSPPPSPPAQPMTAGASAQPLRSNWPRHQSHAKIPSALDSLRSGEDAGRFKDALSTRRSSDVLLALGGRALPHAPPRREPSSPWAASPGAAVAPVAAPYELPPRPGAGAGAAPAPRPGAAAGAVGTAAAAAAAPLSRPAPGGAGAARRMPPGPSVAGSQPFRPVLPRASVPAGPRALPAPPLTTRSTVDWSFSSEQLSAQLQRLQTLTRRRADVEQAKAAEVERRQALSKRVAETLAELRASTELPGCAEHISQLDVLSLELESAAEAHARAHDALEAELRRRLESYRAAAPPAAGALPLERAALLDAAARIDALARDVRALADDNAANVQAAGSLETALRQLAWWAPDSEAEVVAASKDSELTARVDRLRSALGAARTRSRARAEQATALEAQLDALRALHEEGARALDQLSALGPTPGGSRRTRLRPLSAEQEQTVASMWRPPHPKQPALVELAGQQVSRYDLATLRETQWVNDEVINLYLKLVLARAQRDGAGGGADAPLRAHVFQTFFWTKLMETDGAYTYKNVRRWTKKVDLFALDAVVIPINQHQTHWVLALINVKERRFEFYDSMGGGGGRYLAALRRYICDEYRDKKGEELDLSGWTDHRWTEIPQQTNGFDCGVFMCQFASTITRNVAINFSSADMPYMRKRMVIEILDERLMSDDEISDDDSS